MKKLLVICITALFAGCHTNVDLEQQVDELYAKMSQEERIAQLRSMYMDELFDEQGKLDAISRSSVCSSPVSRRCFVTVPSPFRTG